MFAIRERNSFLFQKFQRFSLFFVRVNFQTVFVLKMQASHSSSAKKQPYELIFNDFIFKTFNDAL